MGFLFLIISFGRKLRKVSPLNPCLSVSKGKTSVGDIFPKLTF